MNQTTSSMLGKVRKWLEDSSEIMSRIESGSNYGPRVRHRVGMEWAGCLSRLDRLH